MPNQPYQTNSKNASLDKRVQELASREIAPDQKGELVDLTQFSTQEIIDEMKLREKEKYANPAESCKESPDFPKTSPGTSNGVATKTRQIPAQSSWENMPLQEVWQRYKETRDLEIREFLITKYLSLVNNHALRIKERAPKHVEFSDLYQDGVLGLMKAIDSYDPTMKTKFETFSFKGIKGAMLVGIGSRNPFSKTIRQRYKTIETIKEESRKQKGEVPTDLEIQEKLKTLGENPQRVMKDGRAILTYGLEEKVNNGGPKTEGINFGATLSQHREPSPYSEAERKDIQDKIFKRLSEREKLFLILRYYEGMTQKEIGATLGLSSPSISKMQSNILERLSANEDLRKELS